MSDEAAMPKRGWGIRVILTRLFQAFIVLCLVDGFLDIAYPTLGAAKSFVQNTVAAVRNAGPVEPGSIHDVIRPLPKVPLLREPGISGIVGPFQSPRTNVDDEGRRSNGQPRPENAETPVLLLGSSSAFGFGVADDQTLSAYLERALGTVRVDNYAGLLQPLPDNMLRWWDLQNRNGKPGFAIIAGASFQLYDDCMPMPAVSTTRNALLYVAERLTAKVAPESGAPCRSDESVDLAIRHSIVALESAVAFGRTLGVPFYIVYLPTPYDADVNVENLLDNEDFKAAAERMRPVYRRYHEELAKLDLPEFINLVGALPSDKPYFIDAGAHLSGEGNALIAARLAERIRRDRASGLPPDSVSPR